MMRSLCIAILLVGSALSPLSAAFADDDRLDVVAPFELKGPDPILSGDIFLKMDVLETLVQADTKGRLLPGLATQWSTSEDGLVWTFILREKVKFHDDSLMDARAVAKSLNRSREHGGLLAKAPIAKIEPVNEKLVITLSEPFAVLPAMLAEYRSAIVAPSAINDKGDVTKLLGTGAYHATKLLPPNKLEVTRFDAYWGHAPVIEHANYHAVSRSETRALMAESGDADITVTLDPASVRRLGDADNLKIHSVAIPRVLMLKVNGALYDTATRKALSMAIDRQGIARAVLHYPSGATQMFPPSMANWHDAALEPLKYDPEGAKTTLAQLGWQAGADGVLHKDGKPLDIEILTYPDRPELPLVAAVLQQQFTTIGAKATINATNFSEIPLRHNDGSLNTALFARNFGLVPDPVGTLLQDFAPTSDWGAMGWKNDDFTAGIKALARGNAPEGTRSKLIATLQAELPVLPIAWYQQTMAVSNKVTGVVIDPFERTLGLKYVEWKP